MNVSFFIEKEACNFGIDCKYDVRYFLRHNWFAR